MNLSTSHLMDLAFILHYEWWSYENNILYIYNKTTFYLNFSINNHAHVYVYVYGFGV